MEHQEPAGANHVSLYHINGNPVHDYDLQCACPVCYARTQHLIAGYWSSDPVVQTYTRKQLKSRFR
jgi:hypothetical protein